MNKLVIGTRSSNLALTQTKYVIKKLKEIDPTINFVIKKIKTKGDILLDKDLNNIIDKGFFVSEIQENMVGHKLGEFSPTRSFRGHRAQKKSNAGDDNFTFMVNDGLLDSNVATDFRKDMNSSSQDYQRVHHKQHYKKLKTA